MGMYKRPELNRIPLSSDRIYEKRLPTKKTQQGSKVRHLRFTVMQLSLHLGGSFTHWARCYAHYS